MRKHTAAAAKHIQTFWYSVCVFERATILRKQPVSLVCSANGGRVSG